MKDPVVAAIIAAVIAAVVFGVAGFLLGYIIRKKSAEKEIGSATEEAKRIVSDALTTAENRKRELIIEAKDEIHRERVEFDAEIKERRGEVQRQERRLSQKEDNIDRKTDAIEKKEEAISKKEKLVEEKLAEAEELKKVQFAKLETISGYSKDQAKQILLSSLETELVHDKARKINEYKEYLAEESDNIAREILASAIQRCAADHSASVTISVVDLPNDDMKGRIIGREGRNIHALESITGADFIIDDTPEAITVSCFDPVRREKARLTLEKLIQDGRIHPTKIEELYAKASKEIDNTIRQAGEKAVIEAGVSNVSPELVKLLGKLRYRTSYGQNVLNHSLEVSYIAGLIASELGADVKSAKRAGLLHDIGKALDHENEGTHIALGVEAAKRAREKDEIIHAIEAHHGDVEARTTVAVIVQAADAVSAARPGARRDDIQNYIKRIEELENLTKSFEGVDNAFAFHAGREVRVIVRPEIVGDDSLTILARDIARKIEEDLEYPGQIKVNIIRETKASDIAK